MCPQKKGRAVFTERFINTSQGQRLDVEKTGYAMEVNRSGEKSLTSKVFVLAFSVLQ